jgi:hypothetical protein
MGALTKWQKAELYRSHFIPYEVRSFDNATTPSGELQHFNFDTPAWQSLLRSRMAMVDRLRKGGKTDEDIDNMLIRWYEQKAKSEEHPAFGQLQAMDASPSARNKKISDGQLMRMLMARAKYKKILPKTAVLNKPTPRHIPHPPKRERGI